MAGFCCWRGQATRGPTVATHVTPQSPGANSALFPPQCAQPRLAEQRGTCCFPEPLPHRWLYTKTQGEGMAPQAHTRAPGMPRAGSALLSCCWSEGPSQGTGDQGPTTSGHPHARTWQSPA